MSNIINLIKNMQEYFNSGTFFISAALFLIFMERLRIKFSDLRNNKIKILSQCREVHGAHKDHLYILILDNKLVTLKTSK